MFTNKRLRLSKGFTLVELLVVIAIIGVLATLLLLQLGVARAKARDTKRIADVNQLRTSVELFFDDNGGCYPTAITQASGNLTKYLSSGVVPADPLDPTHLYQYAFTPNVCPKKFHLWTELEQYNSSALGSDADIVSTGWSGDAQDASVPANAPHTSHELCAVAWSTSATDCIYDQGQI